jgi:hypothetical protein
LHALILGDMTRGHLDLQLRQEILICSMHCAHAFFEFRYSLRERFFSPSAPARMSLLTARDDAGA